VLPVIRELQAAGATSHNAIAGKLNERKVPARRREKGHMCRLATLWRGQRLNIDTGEDPGGLRARQPPEVPERSRTCLGHSVSRHPFVAESVSKVHVLLFQAVGLEFLCFD
jgi:hypothetical protein